VLHWLISGSEKTAMDSLVSVLHERAPDIEFVNTEPNPRDCAKRPCDPAPDSAPDSFQTIGGDDLRQWAKMGALAPIDALAVEQRWLDLVPSSVLDSARWNGTLYGVPLNLERDNTLFYNKALFAANGIAPPTSVAAMLEAARAFDAKGVQALSVSASGGWTIADMLFEGILVAEAGPDFVEAYLTGQLKGDAPELQVALTDLAALLDYANPDRGTTGWGDAVKRLCSGEAAMLMMGDFVKGQLEVNGCLTPDEIGYVPLEPPGAPTFVFVGIMFPLAQDARHPRNGAEFLKVVGSEEGQASFNRLKLSVPPRLDADLSGFDYVTVEEAAEYRAPGEHLLLGFPGQSSPAYQEAVQPALQSFADPASPDHKNSNALLTVLRDNYDKIRR
jgi:glucose/mannose transport system substrate-binding protein